MAKIKYKNSCGMVLMIIDLFTIVKMINYQNLCHQASKKPVPTKPIRVEGNVIWQGRIKVLQGLTSSWHIFNYTHQNNICKPDSKAKLIKSLFQVLFLIPRKRFCACIQKQDDEVFLLGKIQSKEKQNAVFIIFVGCII